MEANKTDNFYKEVFSGFEYKLSGSAFWRKLKWRLFWIDFKYYIAGAGVLAIIGAGLFFGLSETEYMESLNIVYPYQTGVVDYQHTVVQTLEINNQQAENDLNQLNNLQLNALVVASAETKNDDVVNEFDRVLNVADGSDFSDIQFETPSNLQAPVIRDHASLNELSSVSGFAHNDLKPELIYDSISRLFIPRPKVYLSMAFYVSPAYNLQQINSNGGYDEYQQYRTKNEKPAISFSAGIDLQVNIKNWYIQTGLAYTKFNNYRNYNHTFLAYDSLRSYYTNDTTWGWLFDPPEIGKPVVIGIDTVWVPVYNDLNEGQNEWNYLEIPLLVGYKFNKSRFSFDIATGFSYGLLINASGNVPALKQENLFTDLSDMHDQINRNQFNYILQLGVSYHLTPAWSMMAKPFYKQNLRSIFNDTYPIDQRFSSFGIKFGLIVNL